MGARRPPGRSKPTPVFSTSSIPLSFSLLESLSSSTHDTHSQSIAFEVTKSECLPLQYFHFGVKSFGDAVIPREAPHRRDFDHPRRQGLAELHQRRQSACL